MRNSRSWTMIYLFKLNRLLKNWMIESALIPDSVSRVFGFIRGKLGIFIFSSRICPQPHRPERYVASMLEPGDTYLDIGASFGSMVTLAQAAVGRKGCIYAFEPQTKEFNHLMRAKKIRMEQCYRYSDFGRSQNRRKRLL